MTIGKAESNLAFDRGTALANLLRRELPPDTKPAMFLTILAIAAATVVQNMQQPDGSPTDKADVLRHFSKLVESLVEAQPPRRPDA